MRKRFFYATLVPSLTAVFAAGFIARGCSSRDVSASQVPVQPTSIDCIAIDPIADRVVAAYATQFRLPSHVADYVAENMCNALSVEAHYGIPAAGVLAKAGSEHSFGQQGDKICRANNHFGIKYKEQYAAMFPNCVDAASWEYNPTNKTTDCFVIYDSSLASYLHFGEFLATRQVGDRKPYTEVMQHLGTSRDFLIALAASEYSTNPHEEQLTLDILAHFHLDEIVAAVKKDLPVGSETKTHRVLEQEARYNLDLYSDGFEQGDLIVAKITPHAVFTDATIQWSIQRDNGTTRAFTLPKITDNGIIYALLGSDVSYPAQTGTLTLDFVVDGKNEHKEYAVPIGAVSATPQDLPTDTQNAAPTSSQDKRALDREEALLYPSWRSITKQHYFDQGYHHPVDGSCDSDEFGAPRTIGGVKKEPHKGIDCDGVVGDPIYAVLGGTVALAEQGFFYTGNATVVDHGFGLYTYYAHQSKQTVFKGTYVPSGTKLGEIGETGRTTGPHLHIGGKLYEMNMNPASFAIVEEGIHNGTR
jgi:murein DD-endopeptidase MepM/ murein hydrolase activator NlpD